MRYCRYTVRLAMLAALLGCAGAAAAAELDLHTWQTLPVFDRRLTSLDTFARAVVETICGDQAPTLSPAGAGAGPASQPPAAVRRLFPGDRARRFSAAELLLSWLIEPEKWEYVPFLAAEDEQLREDVLELPLFDTEGRRLRYVSPWQLAHNEGFYRHWEQLRRRRAEEGKDFKPTAVERALEQLIDAYDTYRRLTFDPAAPGEPRVRFMQRFRNVRQAWARLVRALQAAGRLTRDDDSGRLVIQAGEGLDRVAQRFQADEFQLDEMDAAVAALREQTAAIHRRFADEGNAEPRVWALIARDMDRQAAEMHRALYDAGLALRLVPALSLSALEANRTPEDDAHPWLSFQTLLAGSDALLADYPQDELAAVRRAFERVRLAYLQREAADRPARFAVAMDGFAAALRRLGQTIEPIRGKLPLAHRDEQILEATAYPPGRVMEVEVFYNQLDPFYWAWLIDLAAVVCLTLSLGVLRRGMFALGLALLAAGQAMVLVGLGLRWKITGLVPLTGMFETVVFMGLGTALLGIWFVFLPLLWPPLRAGWRLAAVPFTPEAALRPEDRNLWRPIVWELGNRLLFAPRMALTGFLAWWLVRIPGVGEHGYFDLLPRMPIASSWPSLGNVLIWGVGWGVLLLILYAVPRLVLALIVGLVVMRAVLARRATAGLMEQVAARKPFALVGAVVALLAGLLACYAPPTVLSRGLEAPRPILRHNFWLLVHVLTITASYAAGALAWGLGNVALGFYLFGRYRPGSAGPAASADTDSTADADSTADDPLAETVEAVAPEAVPEQTIALDTAPVEAIIVETAPELSLPEATEARDAASPGSVASAVEPNVPNPSPRTQRAESQAEAMRAPQACGRLAGYTYRALQIAVLLVAAGTILGAMWGDVAWGRFWGWDPKEVWALVTLLVYMVILHGRHIGWVGEFGIVFAAVAGFGSIVMAWYGVNFVLGSGLHAYASGAGGQMWVGAAVLANLLLLLGAAVRHLSARWG